MIISGKELAAMYDVGNIDVCATKADNMEYVVEIAKKYKCCSVFGLKC